MIIIAKTQFRHFTTVQPVLKKSAGLADRALFIHLSAKNSLNMRHALSTTAFCVRIYMGQRGDQSVINFRVTYFTVLPCIGNLLNLIHQLMHFYIQ